MPQFDVNPVTNPGSPVFGLVPNVVSVGGYSFPVGSTYGVVADTPAGGGAGFANQPGVNSTTNRKRRAAARKEAARRRQEARDAAGGGSAGSSGGSSGGSSSGSSGSGSSGGSSGSDSSNSNTQQTFNPLYMRYKTPKEIRQEARDLALLGAVNPAELRRLQQQQEYGLQNLTGAAQTTMEDIAARSRTGLGGLIGVGGAAAGAAQTAEQANLAAAGAAPTLAPGGNDQALSSQALNLSASTMGYAPAAVATGQRLVGESRSALTKALIDRANQISSDTAKYLTQLQNYEYQRAVAAETAAQNNAMLGLRQYQAQSEDAYRRGSLAARNDANAIRAAAAGATTAKDFRNALATLTLNASDYTSPGKVQMGNEYRVTVSDPINGTKQVTAYGNSPGEAIANANLGNRAVAMLVGPHYVDSPRTQASVLGELVPYIIQMSNGTWSVAKAKQWIRANMPGVFSLPAA